MKIFKILKIIIITLLLGGGAYLLLLQDNSEIVSDSDQSIDISNTEKEEDLFDESGYYEQENESFFVSARVPLDEDKKLVEEVVDYQRQEILRFQDIQNDGEILETASFPWSLYLDYKTYESEHIISYVVQGYEYTGGAHGNASVKSFNYDKKTGKMLDIGDIISDEDSLNVFSALLDKELVVEYPEGGSGTFENWSVWFAHDDSVTFIFAPYQIAPYSAGQQEFTIKVTGQNENLFNMKYFLTQ